MCCEKFEESADTIQRQFVTIRKKTRRQKVAANLSFFLFLSLAANLSKDGRSNTSDARGKKRQATKMAIYMTIYRQY
jgi:hypothetical protein